MTGLASEDDEVLMAFATQPPKTSHPQRSLLAIVMLAIMLGCVAWAWYIVQSRTVLPENNAKAILAEIRSRKLKFYWGDQPQWQYYVVHNNKGQAVGWQAMSNTPVQDGYAGSMWENSGRQELWKINEAATVGNYLGQLTLRDERIVQIRLDKQAVTVKWIQDGTEISKAPPAEPPDTYIPEGLMPLVIRLVSQTGQTATFHTILNSQSIHQGHVNFATVRMEPVGKTVNVQTFGLMGTSSKSLYMLDDKGAIASIHEGEYMVERTTLEDLLKVWPNDPVLRKLAEQTATQESQEVEASTTTHQGAGSVAG
jgi:hypothetical protein